jgi:hypothetical protein
MLSARIYADGEHETAGGLDSGGSGGSIYVVAETIIVAEPSQPFYARGGNRSGAPPLATGGDGRIHFACSGDCSAVVDDAVPAPYVP